VKGYLTAVKKVCVKYGVLLALDEVMCGMGRTGYLHAWQEENVVPDVQILGKGLAGGYAQISAILIGPTIVDAFVHGPGNGAFSHGHTFQNFPVACATGLAVQRIIQEDSLLDKVREKAPILRQKLEKRLKTHRYVGDIRGKGYFLGVRFLTLTFWVPANGLQIEFVVDKETKHSFDPSRNIAWRLHERGT
jgi:adenosylmethionine-8-amino-7-oxononanoate aminotransferase